MGCPRRLTLHHHAQNAVDARLVALAMTLEPIEHVLIQTNGQLLFRRRPGHRRLFEKDLVEPRNVRIVNIGTLHTVNACQVASFLSDDGFSVHVGFPFSMEMMRVPSSRGAWAMTTRRPASRPKVMSRSSP